MTTMPPSIPLESLATAALSVARVRLPGVHAVAFSGRSTVCCVGWSRVLAR